MSIRIKKYKKLLMEVKFFRTELEYQEEVLSEYHQLFEEYYQRWCGENDIDLNSVNKENTERVEAAINSSEQRLLNINKKPERKEEKKISKLYKQLAKESHPDKNNGDDKEFKIINQAYENGDWSILLEKALEREIEPDNIHEMIPLLRQESEKLKQKIERNNGMYSWKYYQCDEDEECKTKLVKNFLRQLFKMEI
ncbi:MAG: hypothetical protein GOVbin1807_57 [Prokaryotic dsDNA virus sp.]|nr:MAG: hypothetical protein GOVbin1807_57 [Prokaryotic dsDNA virus sp.]|tara:strand:- start:123 stop:710 length:588 start_codon:yes stop_codon:yes gene_type:complete